MTKDEEPHKASRVFSYTSTRGEIPWGVDVMMNDKTKAEADFDINQFKQRCAATWQQNHDKVSAKLGACLFAQMAFSALSYAIAAHYEYIRSKGISLDFERTGSQFYVSLGLNRIVYQCPLEADSVAILYLRKSPSTGRETLVYTSQWPSDLVPPEQLQEPIEAFVRDMRTFILQGAIPE